MELYRLGSCEYVENLTGEGSRIYGGRFNSIGVPAVYFTTSKALAVLECLVHFPPQLLPSNFCMAKFECNLSFKQVEEDKLPLGWKSFPFLSCVQTIGDSLLKNDTHSLFKLPSAIVKGEFNFILNPSKIKSKEILLKEKESFVFDERLG